MNRVATATLLLSLALLPAACVPMQQQQQQRHEPAKVEKKVPAMPAPLHLGAVHQVYPEQGFALLRIIGPMPAPGATLITHPADGSNARVGNLSVSSQLPSRDNIIAADIRSGMVMKGDRVFRYRNISETSSTGDDIIAADPPGGVEPEVPAPSVNEADIPEPNVAGTNDPSEAPLPASGFESPSSVDTTVLPTSSPSHPDSDPGAPSAPAQAPEYLNSIPDDISGWD